MIIEVGKVSEETKGLKPVAFESLINPTTHT
jgi:hypothetical protein